MRQRARRRGMVGAVLGGALLVGSAVSAGPELVSLPEGYRDAFAHYTTRNRPDERKQVVKIYANDVARASGNPEDV